MVTILSITDTSDDNFQFERLLEQKGFNRIAGTDEVGRGPLAGPVVAACVVLPGSCDPSIFTDSKKTTEKQRYLQRDILVSKGAHIGIGIIEPVTIDKINIHQASLLAMKKSIEALADAHEEPDYILVDGKFCAPVSIPQESLVKGDSRSASIGAASIIAKITRDEIMADIHEKYPLYNFLANKGYPTREHRTALKKYGPCPVHRKSFKGVIDFVNRTDKSGKTR
jgi:ribonuclease HII